MAKHRVEDRIISVSDVEDIPFAVKQLAAEHFERDVLFNIFNNIKDSTVRKYGEHKGYTDFFLYSNEQFGETNAFVLYHTEKDAKDNIVGWVDFVMVRQDNRSEGIGSKMTNLAIEKLEEKGCLAVFIGLLQPKSKEGEAGFPTYGSPAQLKEWGFVEAGSSRQKKVFKIEEELYDQLVFVKISTE